MLLLAALVAGLAGLSGCASADGAPAAARDRVDVVTSFYPLQFVAEQVGGDRVAVTNLTKPGTEPHDLELSARDVAAVADAGLVVYLSGFQPAVDDAVVQAEPRQALDVSAAADLSLDSAERDGAADPHFWLDPTRLAAVADTVAGALAAADPAGAATYRHNARRLDAQLRHLDAGFRGGLADCASRYLVTSHAAFAYLADRYGLRQVGVSGPRPDVEPSATDLAQVADFVLTHDVRTIFSETLASPAEAETVARETGAAVGVLDPLEGLVAGSAGDYLTVMRDDLAALRAGLGCR